MSASFYLGAQPSLNDIELDLSENTLQMTFSALDSALMSGDVDCTNVFLSPTTDSFTSALPLVNDAVVDTTALTVVCPLGVDLQIAIKTNTSFGTSMADTFVYFDVGNGITDGTAEIVDTSPGLSVTTTVIDDTQPPQLASFVEFDLNRGLLTLSFTEVVDVSTLNISDLLLQNDFPVPATGEVVQLTGGDCTAAVNCTVSDVVSFLLAQDDLNEVKSDPDLCASTTDCVPVFTSSFVMDLAGQPIRPYDPGTDRTTHQLLSFIPDTTGPQLMAFELDLSDDLLLLVFDEPVSVVSFNPGGLTLQSASSGGDMVTLTSSSTPPTSDAVTITIQLNADANTLKLAPFATTVNDTFIAVSTNFIDDLSMNNIVPINSSFAMRARNVTSDTRDPQIQSFILDLDANQVLVTFSEPVFIETLTSNNFSISNADGSIVVGLENSEIVDMSGMPVMGAMVIIRFMLDGGALSAIKTNSSIGTDPANTQLIIEPFAFYDTSNNTNAVMQALNASSITEDTTAATLIDFSIDLNIGQLELTFNDVIDAQSQRLDRRTITLQDGAASSNQGFYDLTGGTVSPQDSTVITIDLTTQDVLGIKSNLMLVTGPGNSYITIEAEAFRDVRGVDILAVTDTRGIPTGNYTGDLEPPVLLNDRFDFDLNTGELTLYFDEPVLNSSLVPTSLILQSSAINGSSSVTLQMVTTTVSNFLTVVTVQLERDDLNAVKAATDVASAQSNTYLQILQGAISDTSRNLIESNVFNETAAAFPVDTFTDDTTAPALDSFILDLNMGQLLITFDETVDLATFMQTRLLLRNSSTDPAQERMITGGVPSTGISPDVTFTFSSSDLNYLKLQPSFAKTVADTFLQVLAGGVVDVAGNPSVDGQITMASVVINDTSPPVLDLVNRFVLDLSTDQLLLTFDEPVRVSTLNVSLFTLYNSTSISGGIQLDGTVSSNDGNEITIDLLPEIALTIKLTGAIANSRDDTYLAFEDGAVSDLFGNAILAPPAAIQASNVIGDNTGPLISSFNFDLDSGILTLVYAEPVDPEQFDGTAVTIQDAATATTSYTLTGGSPQQTSLNSTLDILLLNSDLNAIKADTDLATNQNNVYLSLAPEALQDTFGNPVAEVPDGAAIPVTTFTDDTTPPEVSTFDLRNAPNGIDVILVVVFSETVNASTVVPTSFTLLDDQGSTNSYTLTGGTVTLVNSAEIEILLNTVDLDAIKQIYPLGSAVNTSYLSADADAAIDMVGLSSVLLNQTNAVIARNISADLIPPSLDIFSLDMNLGVLSLTFTEDIIVSTLNISLILLQGTSDSTAISQTISSSTIITQADTSVIDIQISDDELNAIKINMMLGTATTNTFISFPRELVRDFAQNLAFEIPSNDAREAVGFIPDTTQPNVIAFDLDMNIGILTLEFDEAVDHSTFDQDQVEIQNHMSQSNSLDRLRDLVSSPLTSADSPTLTVQLRKDDLADIQRRTTLAVSNDTTFLVILNFAIRDMNGNYLVRIPNIDALPVRQFVPDTTPPFLETFRLDLDEGYLYLTFNEAVRNGAANVNFSLFTLQSANSSAMYSHSLTATTHHFISTYLGGIWQYYFQFRVTLTALDNTTIKREEDFCSTVDNCFISVQPGAFINFDDFLNEELSSESALQATSITPDRGNPNLVEFVEFNLRDGYFTLRFDEPVRPSTFNSSRLTFQTLFESPLSSLSISSGEPITVNSDATVSFNLSQADVEMIKLDPFVCTRKYTCYVRLLSDAIQDNAETPNPLNEVLEVFPGFIATSFILDEERPFLDAYELDLDQGTMSFTFSEPVSYSSMMPSSLTIQSTSTPEPTTVTYTLTGGVVMPPNGRVITLVFSEDDICALKGNDSLANDTSTTFIYFSESFVSDLAHEPRPVRPENRTAAVAAQNVIPDTTSPLLSEFQLDLDLDRLLLTFSEPVRTSTFQNLTLLSIHSGEPTPLHSVTLSGGQIVTTEDGVKIIMVMLDEDDITAIKLNTEIATMQSNTYLTVARGAIADMAGRYIETVTRQATTFVPDATRPQLISFALDMNLGLLNLTFDDVMKMDTFDPTAFRVQNNIRPTGGLHYTLTNSTTNSPNGYVMLVEFSDVDFLGIKDMFGLARGVDSTWLTMQAFAIDDIDEIDVLAITDGKAIQVTNYTVDFESPQITSFVLDRDEGQLLLTFTDFMYADSLDTTLLSLQNDQVDDGLTTFVLTLSASPVTRSIDGRTLIVDLTQDDLNALNFNLTVGTSTSDTFLVIPMGSVQDLFMNPLDPGFNSTNALPASAVINDTTPIDLDFFTLDLNTGIITLTFSETYSRDVFNVTALTFQGERNATLRTDSFTLSTESTVDFTSSTMASITLSEDDLTALKARRHVASFIQNTYLSVASYLTQDVSFNPTAERSVEEGLRAVEVIRDMVEPSLQNYTLNLSAGSITFTFSEVVDSQTLTLTDLTIQDAAFTPGATYTLTNGIFDESFFSPVVTVRFSSIDLNGLKGVRMLATSRDDTYISFTDAFVSDMAGNHIQATGFFALQAGDFITDLTPPQLLMYSLDVDVGLLVLNFSEIVDAATLDLSMFTFQNTPYSANSTQSVSLVASSVTDNAESYEIYLAREDINAIKLNTSLATMLGNTFLTFSNASVSDMLGNQIVEVDVGIPPASFIADTSGPVIQNFTLDFGLGTLRLTFDEAVDADTMLVTSFTLQNARNADLAGSSLVTFPLTLNSRVIGESSDVVQIRIGVEDLNIIKSFNNLATDLTNTFLVVTRTGVQDTSNNPVIAIPPTDALQVSAILPDTVGPIIEAFTLDLNTGELFLTFGETINGSSVQVSLFTIQDSMVSSGPLAEVTLTGGTFPSTNDIRTTIMLDGNDLDLLKFRNLANSRNDTFLSLEVGAITDTSGMPGVERTIQATDVILDSTSPTLSGFDFNLNDGTMTLRFDEAVDLTSFILSEVILAEAEVDTTDVRDFSVTNSVAVYASGSLRNLFVTFIRQELNDIKVSQVCRDNVSCFLYFPTTNSRVITVRDIAGNPVEDIEFFEGRPVGVFTPDTTPPMLSTFSAFDLNTGRLIIEFEETVNASSITLSEVTLTDWYSNERLASTPFNVSGGQVFSQNGPIVEFQLTSSDLNGIKADTVLCIAAQSCWIRFSPLFLEDLAGNQVQEVVIRADDSVPFPNNEFADNFTNDMNQPNLRNFTFDLNSGELVFTFDEPIDPTTFQDSELTIQDAASATSSYSIVDGDAAGNVIGTTLRVVLSNNDLIQIKARTMLATEQADTFVTVTSEFIRDTSTFRVGGLTGNPVAALVDGMSALQAGAYTGDVTEPTVDEFAVLDLDSGTLQVIFDEPVDISTFNSTKFHLQSEVDGGTTLSISAATITYSALTNDLTRVDIVISDEDLRDLKLDTDLGTQMGNSYLFVDAGAIQDVSGNPVQPVFSNASLPVTEYIRDTTPPNLEYFSLDLNTGVLHLSFNDIMLASSFMVDLITLQSNASIPAASYTLTGAANVTTENGFNITVMLTSGDLNEIKADTELALNQETTYIVMASNAITDVARVEVIARSNTGAFRVQQYIPDITPPVLESFTFDLGGGVLVLTFTEAVDTVNFVPSQIILQSVANASDAVADTYQIIDGNLVSTANREIYEFYPSVQDLNNIKSRLTLGTSMNNTYIVIPAEAFQDLNNNAIVEITASDALRASMFSDDVVSPFVLRYTFDLNQGIIEIVFSESIQISSLNFTGFVLRSSQSALATEYPLTSGNTTARGGNIIDVIISSADLNAIKALTDLASMPSNTYLSILPGTYEDPSRNPGTPYGDSAALLAANFIPDTTDPFIDSFDFNLGLGIITLRLSETVDPGTLLPNAFRLQSAPAFAVDAVNLTGVVTNSSIGPVIHLFLTGRDLDRIKQTAGFVTARGNTYLAVGMGALQDAANRPLRRISTEAALQVTNFDEDAVRPRLFSFDIDMNTGILTLDFSEAVETDGVLDPASISLHSDMSGAAVNFTLSGGTVLTTGLAPQIEIQFADDDLNFIKDEGRLATSQSNVFVSIVENATLDVGRNLLYVTPPEEAVAGTFVPDTTPPELDGFEIRLIEEPLQIILTFSETVDVSTFVVSRFRLIYGTEFTDLDGSVQRDSLTVITVNVSDSVLRTIRNAQNLARNMTSTVLDIEANAVQDTAGQEFVATNDIVVTVYNADLFPPTVTGYTFDLDRGTITLTFNEAIRPSSLDISSLTLLEAPSSANTILLVSMGNIISPSPSTIFIRLDSLNVDNIKLNAQLATANTSTYITFGAELICDIANNCAEEVPSASALQVTEYIPDTTRPVFMSFNLNVNTMLLTLFFDEVVNGSSIDLRQITFQDMRAAYPTVSYTLTGGTTNRSNGRVVEVTVNGNDKNAMKALGGILSESGMTFISITSELILDMADNYVMEVRPRNAIGVNVFQSDSEAPEIISASLDLNSGILVLNFDETPSLSSIRVNQLTLQSVNVSDYTLQTTTTAIPSDSNPASINILLSRDDLNTIKSRPLCSGYADDCAISYTQQIATDTLGVAAIARSFDNPLSISVTPDTTGPALMEFVLFNYTDRSIQLRFDEPVNATTLDVTQFTLQSLYELSVDETSHQLIVGSVTDIDTSGTIITIQISLNDLFEIQEDPLLCTGRGSCYATLNSGFVEDLFGTPNQAAVGDPNLLVTDLIMDATEPTLDSFSLDLGSGMISLTFSEPVRASGINLASITIQKYSSVSNPNDYYQLSGGETAAVDGDRIVNFNLLVADLNTLKLRDFAFNSSTTYLSVTSDAVMDTNFNSLVRIPMTAAIPVQGFVGDTTPPELTGFTVDVNGDALILTFNEPVMLDTLNISGITLQSANTSSPSIVVSLSPGRVAQSVIPASIIAQIELSMDNLQTIKLEENFATNESNTFAIISANSVYDTAGVPNNLIGPVPATVFLPDVSRPVLLNVSFDIQPGLLDLTFSDVVDAGTFDATALTIQSAEYAAPRETVYLTNSTTTSSPNSYDIQVQLSRQDLISVRDIPNLGTTTENTFITFQAFGIDDVFGVDILAVTNGKALQAYRVVPDFDPPVLVSYALDLNEGTLVFTFSDLVSASSFEPTFLTLSNNTMTSGVSIPIDGGEPTRLTDGVTISLKLTDAKLDEIVSNRLIATDSSTTFLTAEANWVQDLSNNAAPGNDSVEAGEFFADVTEPSIVDFTFNLNTGEIVLTLGELVTTSSFNASYIVLQGASNATSASPNAQYTLTGGTVPDNLDTRVLTIALSSNDLNSIKALPLIASSALTTYIAIIGPAFLDVAGNAPAPISQENARPVDRYIGDSSPPSLTAFDLDMNTAQLTLQFSETVDVTSIDYTEIELQSRQTSGGSFFMLSTGTTDVDYSDRFVITLNEMDVLSLQLLTDLAVSRETTFITLSSMAIRDTTGVQVTSIPDSNAIPVRNYTADITPPQLLRFDLDLDTGFLNLTFTEVIAASSFIPALVSFSPTNATIANITLTSSNPPEANGLRIPVILSEIDLNTLKSSQFVAKMRQSTYLFFDEGAFTDIAGNNITAFTTALRVTRLVPDARPPQLSQFNVDIVARTIELVFDEIVDTSEFSPTSVTLISGSESPPASSFLRLTTSSTFITPNGSVVIINIGDQDFNILSDTLDLATEQNNTFLLLDGSALTDLAGNPIIAIRVPNPFPASMFNPDLDPPSLRAFSLDMNTGILSLTFSEAVDAGSLTASGITLHSTQMPDSSRQSYTLTVHQSVERPEPNVVFVTLSTEDLNGIKAERSLAVDNSSTFISILPQVITDTAILFVTEISAMDALPVEDFNGDTTPPELSRFNFDLNSGVLEFEFTETIDVATIQLSQFVLQSISFITGTQVRLNSTIIPDEDTARLTLALSRQDLNLIKTMPVCTSSIDCYISFPSTVLNDTSGNPITAIPGEAAVLVRNFTQDTTPPVLESFSVFDRNQGQIILTFSEAINIVETLQPSEIRFQSQDLQPVVSMYQLTDGNVVSENTDVLVLNITNTDLNAIKGAGSLCTFESVCFIRFNSTLVEDMAGNRVEAVEDAPFNTLHIPTTYVRDITSPRVTQFDIDLSNGTITLSFDETVDTGALQTRTISLQNAFNTSDSYQLLRTTANAVGTRDSSLTFTMQEENIEQIKARIELATSRSDTFIIFTDQMIIDTARLPNNVVPAVNGISAIQVTNYSPDIISPQLIDFTQLDMNAENIRIEFDEPMNQTVFNFRGISIRSAANSSIAYTLNGGENVQFVDDVRREFQFDLVPEDVRGIKLLFPDLATSFINSYIALEGGSFRDVAGNDNAEVPITAAIPVDRNNYRQDTTSPSLRSFELDVNTGDLTLTFNDVIDVNSSQPMFIELQNERQRTSGSFFVQLTNTIPVSGNDFDITIRLIDDDLNAIKAIPELATSVSNTYIVLGSNAFTDVAGSNLLPVIESAAVNATSVIPDTASPVLTSFTFNASVGFLTLMFTEVVNTSGINPRGFVLQNAANAPTENRRLTGGTPSTTEPARVFDFILARDDINNIKQFLNLGTDTSNTFLVAEAIAISDMMGNTLRESGALPASTAFPDLYPPVLESYLFDINDGIIDLTFSETVNPSSLNVSSFIIQRSATSTVGDYYQLTDSTSSTELSDIVQIVLSSDDLNNIKANTRIATSRETTYLRFSYGAVVDQNNISTLGLPNGLARQAAIFVNDTTPPRLVSYEVDLGPGIITFTFSESVDVTTFEPTAFLLLNTPNIGSAAFQRSLTGGTVSTQNSPIVRLTLNFEDINFIKAETMFFTNEINSYISLTSNAILDTQGNQISPIPDTAGQQARFSFRDQIPPAIQNFTLDLNADTLILTFTETVVADTLFVEGITLLSSPSSSPVSEHTLNGAMSVTPAISPILNVRFLLEDTNELKQDLNLGTDTDSTYLSIVMDAVSDTSGNNISAVDPTMAIQAVSVISDVTPPTLVRFGFEMPSSTPPVILFLEFSETVNASSLRVSNIILRETPDNSGSSHTLTASSMVAMINSFELRITLNTTDLEAIRALPPLGQYPNTTFIRFARGTVLDMASQLSNAVTFADEFEADFITADFIPPELSRFTLDKNLGQLLLTFTEAVRSTTFMSQQVTLSDGLGVTHTITAASVFTSNTEVITIPLTSFDQNTIKDSATLGRAGNTTFVSFPARIVEDIAGNDGLAATSEMAAEVVADTSSPEITQFSIDFQTMRLELVFSEPIDVTTLDVRHIRIQNEQAAFPNSSYRLQQPVDITTSNLSTVLSFVLGVADRNAIKAIDGLGSSNNDTFLAVDPEAIMDTSGNMVARISPSRALPVFMYEFDGINPELEGFGLDLNRRIVSLSFTETVNTATLNLSRVEVHDSSGNSVVPLSSIPISGVTNVVQVALSSEDFITFGELRLCLDGTDCFVDLERGSVADTVNLLSSPIQNFPVSSVGFVPDRSNPRILQFTGLDIGEGLLNLTFSESVDVATFNTSTIRLQSFFEGVYESYQLSPSLMVTAQTGAFVTIYLSMSDISAIKILQSLCTIRSNCYLTADSNTVSDVSGNPSDEVLDGAPGLIVHFFGEDDMRPSLLSFDFDLNSGNLTLYFSEPVDPTSVNERYITLQSEQGSLNLVESYSLTSAVVDSRDESSTIILTLSLEDLNNYKVFLNTSKLSRHYLLIHRASCNI